MKPTYRIGRFVQILALVAMPFSMWVGWIGHNEAGSIGIFTGSILLFFAGYGLTRI